MNKLLPKKTGIIITICFCVFVNLQSQNIIYNTNFGSIANVNPTGWIFSGQGMNISTNSASSGYTGASGGAYIGEGNSVTFTNTAGSSLSSSPIGISTAMLQISTTGQNSITISFGMRKSSATYNANATYIFEWSTDNITYNAINYTESSAGSWGLATGSVLTLPPAADNQTNLYLRFTFNRTGTSSNFKIDDFKVSSGSSVATTTPSVNIAYLYNSTTVKVKFSEAVTISSATTTTNYTFTPAKTISSITLNTLQDTATLYLTTPLSIGINHTISVNGITNLTANTMTLSQNFSLLNTGITSKIYTWKHPPTIGGFQGLNIPNGGFSGLNYIKGSTNEFYVITDRGPNIDANNNNHAITIGGAGNSAKLFALPSFNPNVIRMKAQGDSLVYLSTFTIKNPANNSVTGLINPSLTGGTGEIALVDTNGTLGVPDVWGIDSEGITEGNDNDFWISEEYGVSIWHTTANGKVLNRYAPYGGLSGAQPQDIGIDTIFKFRNPNKGFEGIAFSPNKKVYGFIQNTILFPASDINLKKNTRLHRFIEIDTKTNTTRMLGYEHDAVPVTGPLSTIKNDKKYIGDAVAVNDHEMLILEHGKSSTESYGKVYLIDITPATPINPLNHLVYASGTKSFEQLLDSTTAAANGVAVVKKTLLIDLLMNGYNPAFEKKEGITIINDTCIAIANDNDFGIVSTISDGVASFNNVKSTIYFFSFPRANKLNLCNNTTITSSTVTACGGDSIQLTSPINAGINYQWKNNTTNINGANSAMHYAKTTGNYELYATNSNGCVSISNIKSLNFLISPTVAISSNTTTICAGQSVTLTASGAVNYTWSPTPASTSTIALTPLLGTTYSVVGSNIVCTSKSSLLINVNPLPVISATSSRTLICNGENTNLTAQGANSYTWNPGNLTGTTVSVSPTLTTNYTVNGKNTNGCLNAISITQSVSACTGLEDIQNDYSAIIVFPNPNSGSFTVRATTELSLSIIDQLGREVKTVELNIANNFQINIADMANGIYYLMNRNNKSAIHQKIVVTR